MEQRNSSINPTMTTSTASHHLHHHYSNARADLHQDPYTMDSRSSSSSSSSNKKMNLGDPSCECAPLDYTWFALCKLLSDPRHGEEDLVAGTARLLPSFCQDPQGICASISWGNEECHYTSDNYFRSQKQTQKQQGLSWKQSVVIPCPSGPHGGDGESAGRIHIYRIPDNNNNNKAVAGCKQVASTQRSDSIDSGGTSVSSSYSNPSSFVASNIPSNMNPDLFSQHYLVSPKEAPVEKEEKSMQQHAPRGRIELVAQLLGQSLMHRRHREERFRFFEDSNDLHAVLVVVNEEGNMNPNQPLAIAQFNPAWMHRLGWSREELTGKNIQDFLHPADVSRTHHFLETPSDDESSRESKGQSDDEEMPITNKNCFENRIRASNGSYHWICWSLARAAGDDRCQQTRRILVTGRDFTERKQAEIELWESQRRLNESQTIARLGQWELDLQQNELYWSGKFRLGVAMELSTAQLMHVLICALLLFARQMKYSDFSASTRINLEPRTKPF